MADALTLRIITPDRIVLDTTAESIRIPGTDGSIGILPRHAAMVAALDPGDLSYVQGGQRRHYFVSGGFAEVREGTIRVVSDAAEQPTDIDLKRATEAAKRARERLRESADRGDHARALLALQRALMRERVSRYG